MILYLHDTALSGLYFDSYISPMFPDWLTTKDNNILMKPKAGVITYNDKDLKLEQRLDMQSPMAIKKPSGVYDKEYRVLNVHKYGSFWTMVGKHRRIN